MINLFEYQNRESFTESFDDLEIFLDEIWNRREKSGYYTEVNDDRLEVQQFLQFIQKSKEVKSNKYVGVIHFEDYRINLLPKIFFEQGKSYDENDIRAINNHVLWWLSYCRKIKFPSYNTPLDTTSSDFFEVLIYLFSKYTRELLSKAIYQQYREVESEMSFVKGRINMNRYIHENLSRARWHKVHCVYDPFVVDNEFNQTVKYVTSLLLGVTTNPDSKKYLRQILFILDDVSDAKPDVAHCTAIQFNPALSGFETVRDYCLLFLNNSISFNYKNNMKLFAFLLPMEYVFEDFIYGFIEKEMEGVKALSQVSSTYLDEESIFLLRPDLILKTEQKEIIADTKYKIVYSDDSDPKRGISQSDLYQMVAYAIRFNIDEIALFYPDTLSGYQYQYEEFQILDRLAGDVNVSIKAWQLPIINRELFDEKVPGQMYLEEAFEGVNLQLQKRISEILELIEQQ